MPPGDGRRPRRTSPRTRAPAGTANVIRCGAHAEAARERAPRAAAAARRCCDRSSARRSPRSARRAPRPRHCGASRAIMITSRTSAGGREHAEHGRHHRCGVGARHHRVAAARRAASSAHSTTARVLLAHHARHARTVAQRERHGAEARRDARVRLHDGLEQGSAVVARRSCRGRARPCRPRRVHRMAAHALRGRMVLEQLAPARGVAAAGAAATATR